MAENEQERQPVAESHLEVNIKTVIKRRTHKQKQTNKNYTNTGSITNRNYGKKKRIRTRNYFRRG